MGNKLLVIASGGLDSTVLYYYYRNKYDVKIMNFRYGSKHNEVERKKLRQNLGCEIIEIDINLNFLESALLNKNVNIPEGYYHRENMKQTVIPFRNAIMLSYAVAYADSKGIKYVAIGSHAGDHYIYPDCRPEFNGAFREAARVGTENHVVVLTPFQFLRKSDIVKIGIDLGILDILYKTYSCYNGRNKHCGRCGACTERKEAFQINNVEDLTEYE